jgi:hypothetical protein
MANLFYPQLVSGAIAQYPIRKVRTVRTIKNILPDGNMILFSDPDGARLVWELAYTNLSEGDAEALQTHFSSCAGPFHGFTFIDPTDNMLVSSSDLTGAAWLRPGLIQISPGAADPAGGNAAFVLTNAGQSNQEITQTLAVPSGYQYCFSVFVMSANASALTLIRRGSTLQQETSVPAGPNWTRVVSSGQLNDSGTAITVGISLAPGQQVQVYGPQLEAQIAPSRYRPTEQTGGVYANAHWAIEQLSITALAPDVYSTVLSIETSIKD